MEEAMQIDFDTWFENFVPIANPNGVCHFFQGMESFAFGRFGDDHEVIVTMLRENPGIVWTVIEDDEDLIVRSGYLADSNVKYYFLTEVPLSGDEEILVLDELMSDERVLH